MTRPQETHKNTLQTGGSMVLALRCLEIFWAVLLGKFATIAFSFVF